MEEVGIVLAGGGGKGAYEVGAWLALDKILKECNLTCSTFSGTSVGALNAALFACCTLKEVEEVWNKVTPEKILNYRIDEWYKKCQKNKESFSRQLETLFHTLGDIWENGFCQRNGLEDIIKGVGVDKKIDKYKVFACYLGYEDGKTIYKKIGNRDCVKTLLASSSIPVIFGSQHVDGKECIDGGVPLWGDNLPVKPLIDKMYSNPTYKKIIILHLGSDDKNYLKSINFDGCKVYHIFPSQGLGGTIGTLDFCQETIQQKKKLGKEDVEKDYVYMQRIKSFFYNPTLKEQHFVRGGVYDNINSVYNEVNKNLYVKSKEEFIRKIKRDERNIYIDNKRLQDVLEKLYSLNTVAVTIVIGALASFLALEIVSVGALSPLALATLTPIVPILGVPSITGSVLMTDLIGVAIACGSIDVFKKIFDYNVDFDQEGRVILTSKKK